jgi:hypothetical protein
MRSPSTRVPVHQTVPIAFAAWTLLAPVALATPVQVSPPVQGSCTEWRECRQLALDAAARGEYETFHDLAWRAVQRGPRNDPELLYLLARAQCLSGRPHDALVMLQRLAEMGIATDAATNDDFRRTRELPGWPAVKALIERAGSPPASASQSAMPAPAVAPGAAPSSPAPADTAPSPPSAAAPAAPVEAPDAPVDAMAVAQAPVDEAARFSLAPFSPAGLAYDAVSRRFVFGDLHARKLMIIAEGVHHTVNLVGAGSAGFHDVTALEIDPRRGDLWVVSATPDGDAGTLHKLQLVSGRPLAMFEAPAALGSLKLSDVAVTADGTVLVLDSAGRRILRLPPGAGQLQTAMAADVAEPTSLAPTADGRIVYLAHRDGIVQLDLGLRRAVALSAPKGFGVGGFEWIRWYRGSLVGVQALADGSRRIVRLDLGRDGRTVAAGTIIDTSIPAHSGQTFATIAGDSLYYLVTRPGSGADVSSSRAETLFEVVIERVRLR